MAQSKLLRSAIEAAISASRDKASREADIEERTTGAISPVRTKIEFSRQAQQERESEQQRNTALQDLLGVATAPIRAVGEAGKFAAETGLRTLGQGLAVPVKAALGTTQTLIQETARAERAIAETPEIFAKESQKEGVIPGNVRGSISAIANVAKRGIFDPVGTAVSAPFLAGLDLVKETPIVGKKARSIIDTVLGGVMEAGAGFTADQLNNTIPFTDFTLRDVLGEEGSKVIEEAGGEAVLGFTLFGGAKGIKVSRHVAGVLDEVVNTPEFKEAYKGAARSGDPIFASSFPGGPQLSRFVDSFVKAKREIKEKLGVLDSVFTREAEKFTNVEDFISSQQTFFTGRGKPVKDFNNVRSRDIFFTKNKDVATYYGGVVENVTEAFIDPTNFKDLSTQQKKTQFVIDNFGKDDVLKLFPKFEPPQRFIKEFKEKATEDFVKKQLEFLKDESFFGGKKQKFLLDKLRELGFRGAILGDKALGDKGTFKDTSFVVFDRNSIKTKDQLVDIFNKSREVRDASQLLDITKQNVFSRVRDVTEAPVIQGPKRESAFIKGLIDENSGSDALMAAIRENPRKTYNKANNKSVEDAVNQMGRDELFRLATDESRPIDSITTASAGRLIKEFDREGKTAISTQIIESLAGRATGAGQFIQFFSVLKNRTTKGILDQLDSEVDKRKQSGQKKARILPRDRIEIEQLHKEFLELPEGSQNAEVKARQLQSKLESAVPKTFGELYSSLIQGGILGPSSLERNVVENTLFLPVEGSSRTVAVGANEIAHKLVGAEKVNALSTGFNKTFANKAKEALKFPLQRIAEAKKQGKNFPEMVALGETMEFIFNQSPSADKFDIRTNLHPVMAGKKFYQGVKNKDITLTEASKFLMEATLGMYPKAMFAGLTGGDKPTFSFHHSRGIDEKATLLAIKETKDLPKDIRQQKFKETKDNLLGEPTSEMMEFATKEAKMGTFMQRGIVADSLNQFKKGVKKIPFVGNIAGPAVEAVVPFVTTPVNVVSKLLQYNPSIGFSKSALDFISSQFQGESKAAIQKKRDGYMAMGRGMTGMYLTAMGETFAEEGLVSSSLSDSKEERELAFEAGRPPNHWNIDATIRFMQTGESGGWQKGDFIVDARPLGLAGNTMIAEADLKRLEESGEIEGGLDRETEKIFASLRNLKENTFLRGFDDFISALDGQFEGEKFIKNFLRTLTAPFSPQLLKQTSRASDPLLRDSKSDSLEQGLTNMAKEGSFMGEDLVPRLSVLNRTIPKTPEGRNAYVYGLFDIFKGKRVQNDPLATELLKLTEKLPQSERNSVIPNHIPQKSPGKERLTTREYFEVNQAFGELLNPRLEQMFESDFYQDSPVDIQAAMVKDITSKTKREYNATRTDRGIQKEGESALQTSEFFNNLEDSQIGGIRAKYSDLKQKGNSHEVASEKLLDVFSQNGLTQNDLDTFELQ